MLGDDKTQLCQRLVVAAMHDRVGEGPGCVNDIDSRSASGSWVGMTRLKRKRFGKHRDGESQTRKIRTGFVCVLLQLL